MFPCVIISTQARVNICVCAVLTGQIVLTYHVSETGSVYFRCTNGDFYAALGSSMSLALLVWVGGGLLTRVLYFFC